METVSLDCGLLCQNAYKSRERRGGDDGLPGGASDRMHRRHVFEWSQGCRRGGLLDSAHKNPFPIGV
ncbi:hypothetical protein [Kutzneria buriramensis]|uniref:hypothetical protein n=1 Tax=Kutzneria buriramensis TaxID=1045776 RepID=UPI00147742D1|nr:hypothetical protein [Kutzneria buriramensis]